MSPTNVTNERQQTIFMLFMCCVFIICLSILFCLRFDEYPSVRRQERAMRINIGCEQEMELNENTEKGKSERARVAFSLTYALQMTGEFIARTEVAVECNISRTKKKNVFLPRIFRDLKRIPTKGDGQRKAKRKKERIVWRIESPGGQSSREQCINVGEIK